eukprot:10548295-Lingulodinium_polyedra.AAC.2
MLPSTHNYHYHQLLNVCAHQGRVWGASTQRPCKTCTLAGEASVERCSVELSIDGPPNKSGRYSIQSGMS